MVRLAVSVEGQTEERFVEMVIKPYLEGRGVYVTPQLLGAHGGGVAIPKIKKDLNILAGSFEKVTTLYDFYGFKGKDDTESKESLESKIVNCVAAPLRDKIIPYVQMYEFEGLLFTSPEAIENNIRQSGLSDWATKILQQFGNDPEKINDSPQTAPSKRLLNKTHCIKTVHGPDIADEIGLATLRKSCAGFDDWLDQLEALAE